MKYKNLFISIILSTLLVSSLYTKPVIKRYDVVSDKLEPDSICKVIVIADLHNTQYGINNKIIVDKIEKTQPDLILLAGDLISSYSAKSNTLSLIQSVSDIAPLYYVTGNHEFWTHMEDEFIEILEELGVKVLRNEFEAVEISGMTFYICGTDDPDVIYYSDDEKYASMKNPDELLDVFEELDSKMFNLLIAHRPERIESYLEYDFDLIVSGHAHGGQVRVPFLINGLFAPNQGWFPKYAGGRYQHDDTTHIVSRGLSVHRLPRIFNPPELVLISLKGK